MRENLSIERLRRLSEATPEQLAAIDLILGLEKVEVRTGESGNGEGGPALTGRASRCPGPSYGSLGAVWLTFAR